MYASQTTDKLLITLTPQPSHTLYTVWQEQVDFNQNEYREVLLLEVSLKYSHPAKFDNFKDEEMSDYKIVSVAQSRNLLDCFF